MKRASVGAVVISFAGHWACQVRLGESTGGESKFRLRSRAMAWGEERNEEVAHAVRAVHMRLALWALVVIAMISSSPVNRAGIELRC